MKNCKRCSKDITGTHSNRKFCSDKCKWLSLSPERKRAKRDRWLKRNGAQYVKEYNAKNKERLLELNYNWKKKNPEASKLIARKTLLKRSYGITLEQYEEILQKQDYKCAVCKRHKDEFTKNLAVDHDHKTGEIRGALCTHCNRTIIGRNRDAEIFMNAYKYLLGPFTGWIAPKQKPRKRKKK
jgi:DNA-directed RNA polymerase subunit RPC12/RpoP